MSVSRSIHLGAVRRRAPSMIREPQPRSRPRQMAEAMGRQRCAKRTVSRQRWEIRHARPSTRRSKLMVPRRLVRRPAPMGPRLARRRNGRRSTWWPRTDGRREVRQHSPPMAGRAVKRCLRQEWLARRWARRRDAGMSRRRKPSLPGELSRPGRPARCRWEAPPPFRPRDAQDWQRLDSMDWRCAPPNQVASPGALRRPPSRVSPWRSKSRAHAQLRERSPGVQRPRLPDPTSR